MRKREEPKFSPGPWNVLGVPGSWIAKAKASDPDWNPAWLDGKSKSIKSVPYVQKPQEICPVCHGTGYIKSRCDRPDIPCPHCR